MAKMWVVMMVSPSVDLRAALKARQSVALMAIHLVVQLAALTVVQLAVYLAEKLVGRWVTLKIERSYH